MTNQVIPNHPQVFSQSTLVTPRLMPKEQPSLLQSLIENIKDALFPEKLPPLKLTSRPVAVRSIWEQRSKKAATTSLILHALAITTIVGLTLMGAKAVTDNKKNVV